MRWWQSKEFGPYSALLAALILFCSLLPIVDSGGAASGFVRVGFSVVLFAGLAVARGNRTVLITAIILALANLMVQWLAPSISDSKVDRDLLRAGLGAIYLGYLIAVLVRSLLEQRVATADTVLGGINVYLLLALAFMDLHLFVEHLEPGSYLRGGLPMIDPEVGEGVSLDTNMFYFSFTTLTTLGYGDIAPSRPVSQFLCSAEAVIGNLFTAIFIGGLVALRISGLRQERHERNAS